MNNQKKAWRIHEVRGALLFNVAVQMVFSILAGLIFDGGFCGNIVMGAIVGYWMLVLWIALRRRDALTKTDVILVKSGFFLWLLIIMVVIIGLRTVAEKM